MSIEILKCNIEQVESKLPANYPTPKIVAVTKFTDIDTMRELYQLGYHHFAENRPQVFLEKYNALEDIKENIHWHFVGNLQTRQVRDIINLLDYVHSLDRPSLAKEINKRANQPIKCFVQVNVSGEDSKSGLSPDELEEFIISLAQYPKVHVIGLMTMAPYEATEEALHRYFAHLRKLRDQVAAMDLSYAPCQHLSMGMSRDYPIAVEEGADFIRIGSALFKE